MRIHTLEATGGVPYSQMPRFATADGKGTNDPKAALQANGQPVDNAARNIWVTETALTTALNTSYMAEQLSLFGIVVGVALLLSGIRLRDPRDRRRPPESRPGDLLVRTQAERREATRNRVAESPRQGRRGPRKRPSCQFLEQTLLDRVADEFGAARQAELLHDVRTVRLGGADRDEELLGDLLVRVPERQQAQDLAFAIGKRILLGLACGVGVGCDQARAELRVRRTGRRGQPPGRRTTTSTSAASLST